LLTQLLCAVLLLLVLLLLLGPLLLLLLLLCRAAVLGVILVAIAVCGCTHSCKNAAVPFVAAMFDAAGNAVWGWIVCKDSIHRSSGPLLTHGLVSMQ
jgi:hypothetical protein